MGGRTNLSSRTTGPISSVFVKGSGLVIVIAIIIILVAYNIQDNWSMRRPDDFLRVNSETVIQNIHIEAGQKNTLQTVKPPNNRPHQSRGKGLRKKLPSNGKSSKPMENLFVTKKTRGSHEKNSHRGKKESLQTEKPNNRPHQSKKRGTNQRKKHSFIGTRKTVKKVFQPKARKPQERNSDQRSKNIFRNRWRAKKRFSQICGGKWYDRYARLHRDILQGKRKQRYLAYSCPGNRWGCCGYGNRLRAVVSLFYLAVLTDRAFIIDWSSPAPIENYLVPNRIQWNHSEILDVCTGMESRRHYWGTASAELREVEGWIIQNSTHFKNWVTAINFARYFDYPVEVASTIWYFAEGGINKNPYLMQRARELQVTPLISPVPKYGLIGCAFDFLFSKSPALQKYLGLWMQELRGSTRIPTIGLHIRTGDDQFDYYASENDRSNNIKNMTKLNDFFKCTRKIERTDFKKNFPRKTSFRQKDILPRRAKWFLATDNKQVKRFAKKHFPNKIVTTNLTIQHLDIVRNSSGMNYSLECNSTGNGSAFCYQVKPFNKTLYCANKTSNIMDADALNANETKTFSEGILGMLVDHFLLAECDFLILSDSSFGSSAVGLGMRTADSYVFGDHRCSKRPQAQKSRKFRFFRKKRDVDESYNIFIP